MLRRRTALPALALVVIAGCGGLKDALTSHVDTAAKVGGQELTATRLAELLNEGQIPVQKELASAVANLWVNYQMLAQAAARSDTFPDDKVVDQAMWAQIVQLRLKRLEDTIVAAARATTSAADLEKAYAAGNVLVARHILISADKNALKPNQLDSARKVAEGIRKQVTAANFAAMAKRYSSDPGSKETGGEYVWPSAQIPAMVPEFEAGTRALKPGEISDPIQTQFGFHIILRESYPEAKSRFDTAYASHQRQSAESVFVTNLESKSDIKVKDDAGKLVKSIAQNLDDYRDNRTVVATARGVDLRASRVANWVAAFPPQMRIRQQLQQAPDSILPQFVMSLMRNELLLRAADSAKVALTPEELADIRGAFHSSLRASMGGLGILPSQLGDSASGAAARAELASSRATAYLERLIKNEAQFVDVSEPVAIALRMKYSGRVNEPGVEKAVTLATELKAKADSALPPTAVPMPGGQPPAGGAGGKQP